VTYYDLLVISQNPPVEVGSNSKTIFNILRAAGVKEFRSLYFSRSGLAGVDTKDKCYRYVGFDAGRVFKWYSHLTGGGRSNLASGASKSSRLRPFLLLFRDLSMLILMPFVLFFCFDRKNRPKAVLCVFGDNVFSLVYSIVISRIYGVKLGVYITDDYLKLARAKRRRGWYSNFLEWVMRQLVPLTDCFFVISKPMRKLYSDIFDVSPVLLRNPYLHSVSSRLKTIPNLVQGVDIGYFGSLHSGRDSALNRVVSILDRVGQDMNCKFCLSVYSEMRPQKVSSCSVDLVWKGVVPADDVAMLLDGFDFSLMLESLDANMVEKTLLSLSTKVPEYLGSQSVAVAFGDPRSESIDLIKRTGSINLADEDSIDQFKSMIADFEFYNKILKSQQLLLADEFGQSQVCSALEVLLGNKSV